MVETLLANFARNFAAFAFEKDFNAKFAEENPQNSQSKTSGSLQQHKLVNYLIASGQARVL